MISDDECPFCGGTGETKDGDECEPCSGSGKNPLPDQFDRPDETRPKKEKKR
jgi:hypothetical protein